MLALTRKRDESIILDGNIQIKVLDISPDKVKLGIVAPSDVNIYRNEIYEEIQRINRESNNIDFLPKKSMTRQTQLK